MQNSDSYVCDICEINCSGKALSDKIAACQKLIESYVRRSPIFLLHACTNFLWNYSYGGKITARGFVSKLHDSVPQPERQRSIETGALVTDTIKRSVTVAQLLMDAGNVGRYAARCVTCHAVTDTGQRPIQDSGANGDCRMQTATVCPPVVVNYTQLKFTNCSRHESTQARWVLVASTMVVLVPP